MREGRQKYLIKGQVLIQESKDTPLGVLPTMTKEQPQLAAWPVLRKRLLPGPRIRFQGFPFKYHHLVLSCEIQTTQGLGRLCAFPKRRTWHGTSWHLGEIMSQMNGSHLLPQLPQAQGREQPEL